MPNIAWGNSYINMPDALMVTVTTPCKTVASGVRQFNYLAGTANPQTGDGAKWGDGTGIIISFSKGVFSITGVPCTGPGPYTMDVRPALPNPAFPRLGWFYGGASLTASAVCCGLPADEISTGTAPNYSFTLINPVSITITDAAGRATDQIQAIAWLGGAAPALVGRQRQFCHPAIAKIPQQYTTDLAAGHGQRRRDALNQLAGAGDFLGSTGNPLGRAIVGAGLQLDSVEQHAVDIDDRRRVIMQR